jgi:hypothetical protein
MDVRGREKKTFRRSQQRRNVAQHFPNRGIRDYFFQNWTLLQCTSAGPEPLAVA